MRWLWIDRIVAHDPGARLVAIKNVSLAEEHLHDHFPAEGGRPACPVMPASLVVEGMAQTAGILVGAAVQFREKVVLAKIALARLDEEVGPGSTLRYEAQLDRLEATGAATKGVVSCLDSGAPERGWREIGAVDLMFGFADRNALAAGSGDGNFVFSDNFRTILATAGLTPG